MVRSSVPAKVKIKSGDTVLVQVGKDRGKTGKVLRVFPRTGRLIVEGRNIVKKHVRPRRAGEKGQRVEVPAPMPVSRVLLICPSCQKAVRVAIRRTDGRRERFCRKCQSVIA